MSLSAVNITLSLLTPSDLSRGAMSEPSYRYILFGVVNQFNLDVNVNDKLGGRTWIWAPETDVREGNKEDLSWRRRQQLAPKVIYLADFRSLTPQNTVIFKRIVSLARTTADNSHT
jgi:hypothetical protein